MPVKWTVVVTGASGFLGHAIVHNLRRRALDVVAVSRKPLLDGLQINSYAETPSGDVLIHLAEERDRSGAQAGGEEYECAAANTLSALLTTKWKKVVYTSSAVLYGDGSCTHRRPSDQIWITDTYTRVKKAGEQAVLDSDIGIVVRLANLYGRGMAPNNVVSTILRQLPGDKPISVWDDAPVRDFIWVEDAAEAIATIAAASGFDHTGIYNVGSGVGTSIRELSVMALDIAGCPGRTVQASRSSNRASCLVLDISDTKKDWGWLPKTRLREGLTRLIHPHLT